MSKLYANETLVGNENVEDSKERELEDISEDISEYSNDLDLAIERFNGASGDLQLVGDMNHNFSNKKLASVDYFVTLENYQAVFKNIANNLGIKCKIPSMEDFKNPYGINTSNEIALEGFFQYLRKIWERIKDIFKAFFKKIGIFARRLVNAELDLETYEEYLEGMVGKIKAKKLKISDSTVLIDSKLPSLLANEGMESVNSDFILTTGERKLKRLTDVTNKVFQNNLIALANKDLQQLLNKLKDLVETGVDIKKPINEIKDEMYDFISLGVNTLNQILGHHVKDINDVPETVYNAIYNHFDRDEMDDMTINSLVDDSIKSDALPKNFNVFYVLSGTSKLFISANVESNSYVVNKLKPISQAENLIKFYDYYKKFSKEVNVKSLDKANNEFQDAVDNIIKFMETKYIDLLEKLKKTKISTSIADKLNTKEEAFGAMMGFFIAMDQDFRARGLARSHASTVLNDLVYDMSLRLNIDETTMGFIINGRGVEDNTKQILDSVTDEEKFVKEIKKFLSDSVPGRDEIITLDELEEIVDVYEKVQRFLTNLLNSLQVMLKEVSINLHGTVMQVRFELVKYLYSSAKLYN